jgi:hypothetical protein
MWAAAVVALLALPRAAVALRSFDETNLRRREWSRRPLEETQSLRELDRAMQERYDSPMLDGSPVFDGSPTLDGYPVLDDAPAMTIEDIAGELRRLDRQRRGGPTGESERWLAAVQQAYDERLCLACRCVGVQQHLAPLEGMDREIERVRVEGALQAAGVTLR